MVMPLRIAAVILPLALVAGEAPALHLAPDGDDAADGSAAHPLATPAGARDALRRLRAGGRAGPARIVLADGTYRIAAPLLLEPQDGDAAWEAAPGAHPVISGSAPVVGFTAAADGAWTAHLPPEWRFEQLFVDGVRATRARQPDAGGSAIGRVSEAVLEPGGKVAKRARQTVVLAPEQAAGLRGLSPDELHEVQLVVYHNWDVTRRPIESFDPATGAVTTVGGGMKPWNPWKADSLCAVENSRAACDAPGEWFLACDGTLTYRPLPGQDPARAAVVAPVAGSLLIVRGDPAGGRPVERLAFRGLAFRHAQWLTPPGGMEPAQAAATAGAAVTIDDAAGIAFEDCEIAAVGAYALWFRAGCADGAVRRCHLHDLGAGGVRIGVATAVQDPRRPTQRIAVDDCIIRDGGRILPSAVGVWIGSACDCSVTRNEIADLFYTGVSVGWRWGYEASSAKRNAIRGNHIHGIGKGLLSDMGGVYTLGPSEGTVVAGNLIHDVESRTYGGWGLYADEGSSGIVFEDNVVYRTTDGSFHQHYGRDNVVRNNILVDSAKRQVVLTRAEDHRSFTFERNIVQWTTGPAISGPWEKAVTTSAGNCWFNAGGAAVAFAGHPLAAWQALGHEAGSVVADPRLADPAHGDFSVPAGSPAVALGFRPFVVQAGVYGDPAWVALAAGR